MRGVAEAETAEGPLTVETHRRHFHGEFKVPGTQFSGITKCQVLCGHFGTSKCQVLCWGPSSQ